MKVLPIATLVEKIATGEVTSYEVVSHYLEVIKEKNGEINAIVTINENALEEAKKADEAVKNGKTVGPLHGIPFTCKDSFKTVGVRTTSGSKKLKDYIPQKDAEIVKQLKAFGAILLAKTNLPELAQDLQTENHLFGKTNNPHNSNYTSGGSSGGEAAAVASGMSPLGIGSDIGGSIRVPAHYCGVAAIKPTEHLLSTDGHIPPLPNSGMTIDYLIHSGIIAKNSSDLHYVLSTIKGTKPQAPIGAFRKSKILWSQ
jgi:amidase